MQSERLVCRRVAIIDIEGGWFRYRPCESRRAYVARVNRQTGLGLSERGSVVKIRNAMLSGRRFSPIVLFKHGTLLHIVDGWHRACAAGELAMRSLYAAVFEPASVQEENAASEYILNCEDRGGSPVEALFAWVRMTRATLTARRFSYG